MATVHALPIPVSSGLLALSPRLERLGRSRSGIWPLKADEGTAITGRYLGPAGANLGRARWLPFQNAEGHVRRVLITRQWRPQARQLRIGETYRLTFLRMEPSKTGRRLRCLVVDLVSDYEPDSLNGRRA